VSDDPVVDKVSEKLGQSLLETAVYQGETTLVVTREAIRDLAVFLRDDPEMRFVRLSDLCGVDYLGLGRQPRFAVVYHFHSLQLGRWIRVRVPVEEDDAIVPSLVPVWPGADFAEREVWDLFGIRFADHPNLERLLLPDDWEGHPLRKDYPVEGYR
jgi:NADH-quinone oxidoreductase subunit C